MGKQEKNIRTNPQQKRIEVNPANQKLVVRDTKTGKFVPKR